MVNFNIRPLGGIENKEVKNRFLLLARRRFFSRTDECSRRGSLRRKARWISAKTVLTPMKTDGDCNLDEMRRPGVKEGLQIDVVRQVGPDANNFSSLFSVRVVKRD